VARLFGSCGRGNSVRTEFEPARLPLNSVRTELSDHGLTIELR